MTKPNQAFTIFLDKDLERLATYLSTKMHLVAVQARSPGLVYLTTSCAMYKALTRQAPAYCGMDICYTTIWLNLWAAQQYIHID